MKKTLRNLMLAGAAALLATGASAQTLEKAWTNSSVPGSQYGGQLRFNVGKDNKVLVTEMDQYKIVAFDAEGKTDFYDLKPAVDEFYGKDVTTQEISKIDTIVSEANDSTFDTTWVDVTNRVLPGVTPTLGMDEAGNILVATGTTGSWTPNFIIISADLQNAYKLEITLPDGAAAGRVDQVGKIIGDMLSAEGAYMWLCPVGEAAVTIKIVEGVQDMDYSQASAATPYPNTSSCIAQPALWTVAEIDALMDDNGSFDGSFYWRHRSYAASVYAYDTDASEWSAITVATGAASNEGLASFKLGEDVYFVVPVVDAAGARSAWFSVVKEDGTVVATAQDNHTGMSSFRSFYVEPINENSVRIYNWVPAKEASVYTFTVAAEEPAVDPLYIFGSFNSWTPAEGLELAYADGVYTIEDIEFGEGGNFGLSTVKSDDWNEVNANRYGFATDNAKAVIGENEIVKGAGAIAVPYAGVWDITVDIANLKLTLATETPEPTPEPEPIVVAPGLNMVWTNTTSTGVGIQSQYGGQLRFNAGKDGKVLVTNMADYKIVAFSAEGAEDYYDLKPAMDEHYGTDVTVQEISKIDTIVSETNDSTFDTTWVEVTNRVIPGVGPALAMDDAGNYLVAAAAAGSSTPDFLIISADLQSSYKLQLTMPEGVAAGRMDQCGKIVGDMLSAEGAYLWLCPQGSASVATIKIIEGVQDMDYSGASAATPYANTSSCIAQPALWTVAEIDALMDENGSFDGSFFWRHRSYAASVYAYDTDASEWKAITVATGKASNEGLATFQLKGENYFVVPVADATPARSAWFSVVKEDGTVMATAEINHTGLSSYRSFYVEYINEEAVRIYNWVPAKEASVYTFALEKEAAPLYLIGDVNGTSWSTSASLPMTYANGVYTIESVEVNDADAGYGYFSFVTAQGDDWDTVNASVRYGAQTSNEAIATNVATAMSENWNAWMIAAGTYNITVDLTAMTVTVSVASGVEGIEAQENVPAVYYNLQGVKVANPENGIYIKVQGNKASKVLVK